MKTIICATRGGQGSKVGRTMAIQRAKELDAQLHFLFVVDQTVINGFDEKMKDAMRAEAYWVGRVMLRIASQQAEAFDVPTRFMIKEGSFKEQVAIIAKQCNADLIMLGASRSSTSAVFGDDAVEQFAQELQMAVGVPVEIARPEDLESALLA